MIWLKRGGRRLQSDRGGGERAGCWEQSCPGRRIALVTHARGYNQPFIFSSVSFEILKLMIRDVVTFGTSYPKL